MRTDAQTPPATNSERSPSCLWATVLAVQPLLAAGALFGTLLFSFVAVITQAGNLPAFLPLVPGALAILLFGAVHLYTPIYVVGIMLDVRSVRNNSVGWTPSTWLLLGGIFQMIYFVVPVVQAYGPDTFEELVFGSVELVTLALAGVLTLRYVHARCSDIYQPPLVISLRSRVWSSAASVFPTTKGE